MKNGDMRRHVTGESLYIEDVPIPEGCLHAAVFSSSLAHATIRNLDTRAAEQHPGVYKVLTARDIPGSNRYGSVLPEDKVFAEEKVTSWGQPIACVIAKDALTARQACACIDVEYEALTVITSPREAALQREEIIPPLKIERGEVEKAFQKCDFIVEGCVENGGQEHLYLEPQGALAIPGEGRKIHLISSTQGPSFLQRAVAENLALPLHCIEIDVRRLGGGFGGKEDQATPWAIMAARAAQILQRPVKLVLPRDEDMRLTGKRHPFSSDFKIGLTKEGMIVALEVTLFQNAGATADLSPPVLSRALLHITNSYHIPHVSVKGHCCRTHLPSNTAFRGFGGPQGVFIIEAAIRKAAEKMQKTPEELQEKNLLKENDTLPYGQKLEHCHAHTCWKRCLEKYDFPSWQKKVHNFNCDNEQYKKGLAITPICFGISFTKTEKNKAGALVHVYQDGSVSVSTGAVEMGQGVNTKIAQAAAFAFSIDPRHIHVESTNTTRVANTSPTAASTGADLNGKATLNACYAIVDRLKMLVATAQQVALEKVRLEKGFFLDVEQRKKISWRDAVEMALAQRIDLSAHGYYSTPEIHFDLKTGTGHPFAYHVYGTAITEVTLDGLRGRYEVDAVRLIHDGGLVVHHDIDRGQIEGGLLQGIGWMTLEDVLYDEQGKLLTDTLSTYKIPDIYAAPKEVEVEFLEKKAHPLGIMGSKAVGEPPFLYGLGAFFALREAIRAFVPDKELPLKAPLTPEKVLMTLYGDDDVQNTRLMERCLRILEKS